MKVFPTPPLNLAPSDRDDFLHCTDDDDVVVVVVDTESCLLFTGGEFILIFNVGDIADNLYKYLVPPLQENKRISTILLMMMGTRFMFDTKQEQSLLSFTIPCFFDYDSFLSPSELC